METERSLTEGFHRLTRAERLARVQKICKLDDHDVSVLSGETALPTEIAEHLIENVVGYFPVPLGVA